MPEAREPRRLEGIRCPTCHGHFDLIRILGRYGGNYKLLVRCPSCKVYGIGTAQAQAAGVSVPLATALGARPIEREFDEPVSERDVAEMREFLDNFDGNFRALWSGQGD